MISTESLQDRDRETHIISRRAFLQFSAFQAVIPTLLPFKAFANTYPLIFSDQYAFADLQGLGPELAATTVESYCCALHDEKPIAGPEEDSIEYQSLLVQLKMVFQSQDLPWDDDNKLTFTFQHYGVPYESAIANSLLHHCQEVSGYLYNRLNNLAPIDEDWSLLVHGDPYLKKSEYQFRAFVGRYTYYVMRAVIQTQETNISLPYLVMAWPVNRAFHFIVSDSQHHPVSSTIYIIPGSTSLISPFSELLHISLHAAAQNFSMTFAMGATAQSSTIEEKQRQTRVAGETITEATSALLAAEYFRKQGYHEKQAIIDEVTWSMSRAYPLIPNAMVYLRRHGIQQGIDLFQDNPAEFMRRIS